MCWKNALGNGGLFHDHDCPVVVFSKGNEYIRAHKFLGRLLFRIILFGLEYENKAFLFQAKL